MLRCGSWWKERQAMESKNDIGEENIAETMLRRKSNWEAVMITCKIGWGIRKKG